MFVYYERLMLSPLFSRFKRIHNVYFLNININIEYRYIVMISNYKFLLLTHFCILYDLLYTHPKEK